LSVIVEKSKKCVDFTFTLFFIDIMACTCYNVRPKEMIYVFPFIYKRQGFPFEWEWWLIQVLSCVLMASAGEYFCAVKELQDIPLYETVAQNSHDADL
jgi:hypothetical protein